MKIKIALKSCEKMKKIFKKSYVIVKNFKFVKQKKIKKKIFILQKKNKIEKKIKKLNIKANEKLKI